MKKKDILVMLIPFTTAVTAVLFQFWILLPVVLISVFYAVSTLSFAHKRENLWLFLLGTISFAPLNLFAAIEYPVLQEILLIDMNIEFLHVISVIETALMLTCIESIILGYFGRMIWRKQYIINLPEHPE